MGHSAAAIHTSPFPGFPVMALYYRNIYNLHGTEQRTALVLRAALSTISHYGRMWAADHTFCTLAKVLGV